MQPYEPIRFPDFMEEKYRGKAPRDYSFLTTRETRAYFAWFQEIMPQRINYLLNYCSAEMGVSLSELRAFPDGFLPLWKWFRIHQTMRNTTPEEIADMRRRYGALGESWVQKRILDDATERLHYDIGMFFGDQFVRHYPNELRWSYRLKPRSYIHVKVACIWGFKKYYDKKGEVDSNFVEPVYLVGSESRQIFWDEMVDDGLLTLAKDLMEYVYDIDTKAIIPPLELEL